MLTDTLAGTAMITIPAMMKTVERMMPIRFPFLNPFLINLKDVPISLQWHQSPPWLPWEVRPLHNKPWQACQT